MEEQWTSSISESILPPLSVSLFTHFLPISLLKEEENKMEKG